MRCVFHVPQYASRRITRKSGIAVLASLSLVLLIFTTPHDLAGSAKHIQDLVSAAASGETPNADLATILGRLLEQYQPSDVNPPWTNECCGSPRWKWGEEANVTSKLELDPIETLKMRDAHTGFMRAVDEQLPRYLPSRSAQNRGIVMIGGGKYFPVLMVSLRFLRRTGSKLPVEVFVTTDEYEDDVCENVLPTLNAACRMIPTLGAGGQMPKGFQLKVFAALFSSFEEVLILDADSTALRDVEPSFMSIPFRETGLVTWPDFWQPTLSPLYFLIASQAGATAAAIRRRPSTESGQLLVSKKRHWKTLLLACYYNYYGPSFYYRLLSQGGAGMGDKDTFLPAAITADLPFYDVRTPVVAVGHRFEDGSTGSRALLQYDVVEDYAATQTLKEWGGGAHNFSTWNATYQHVRPMFLHLSWPKWDATILLDHISKWSDMTTGVDGQPEPVFHHPPALAAQVRGAERMLWEEARWCVCHLHDRLNHWKGNAKASHMCDRLDAHFRDVLDANVGVKIGLGPDDVLFPKIDE